MKSALLWCELFSISLKDIRFELNPYDKCVTNKMINDKQCTVTWYVNDNKISHIDKNVVSDIIKKTEARFGKMEVTRGDAHVLLGMNIVFRGSGTFSILVENNEKSQ